MRKMTPGSDEAWIELNGKDQLEIVKVTRARVRGSRVLGGTYASVYQGRALCAVGLDMFSEGVESEVF